MLTYYPFPLLALSLSLLSGATATALAGLPQLTIKICDGHLIGVLTDRLSVESCILPDATFEKRSGTGLIATESSKEGCGRFIAGFIEDTFMLMSVSAYEKSGNAADIRYCSLQKDRTLQCTSETMLTSKLGMTLSRFIPNQPQVLIAEPSRREIVSGWGIMGQEVNGVEKVLIQANRIVDREFMCDTSPAQQ
ncbi:MAG: hypothetical protein M1829_000767 [Trizodia sp. TS-e1964]|nr:MAG: hypothetical protein M1829_000767 [Trizodia sp. TS-e1964]